MKALITKGEKSFEINKKVSVHAFDGYSADDIMITELYINSPENIDAVIKMLQVAKYCFRTPRAQKPAEPIKTHVLPVELLHKVLGSGIQGVRQGCTKPNCDCVANEAKLQGVDIDSLKGGYPCLYSYPIDTDDKM